MSEEKYIEMLEDGTLYNYITNLQEENQKLKVYLKPEYIVDKIKTLEEENQLLQKELQNSAKINEEHHKINGQLREDLIAMNNKNMELVKIIDELEKWLKANDKHYADAIPFRETLKKLNELKGGKR